jgi:predicted O-methyltransferase YrrM
MLEWENDSHLVVDGSHFRVNPMESDEQQAGDALFLYKPRELVERYVALRSDIEAENIFELGIWRGGSTALLALLFRPRRLVAIDFSPQRVAALDNFIDARDMQDSVRPYFGVDQADRSRLEEIVTEDFGSQPLDLVVDDASHLLAESTASFNVLFPRLRPGGLYVLEDWSWEHHIEATLEEKLRTDEATRGALAERLEGVNPMSKLALEIVITVGYAEGIISEVTSVAPGWFVARRGEASLDPSEFDISRSYGSLGRTVLRGDERPAATA